MDYYCFEDSYIFYRNLINSKLSKIKNSLNEFESLNYNFKSNTLSDNNKLYFCHKTKNHLKQYSISLFNYKTFRNRIREFFDLIHIKNIKDEIKRILKCYKSKINEDRMNFGFSFSISLDSDEIFLHEWCTLICKTNFDESSFSLISNIISNKNLNFIKGDISILCESKKIINITFYEDLTNFQSQFVYRIMSNFQFNHFIFYSSEIKYRSFEDKCFLWKKGNYEKVEQAKHIKHSLVYNNNNVDKRINFSRSVYEKTILSNEITEIKHEWSNDQLEKGDYYKTSVKLSSLNQDYYKITTIITSDSINVLRNEKHSEKKNFSNYEKYGFTNDYFKDKQFSSCSKYIENNDTKIYVKWLKHDNEFKISRFKQDPAQKINEMSGYKYENNVKVYEFIDRHIEFYEDHSSYTTKNGFSISDGNQWKSYAETKDNHHFVENWGKNEFENKEWFEKWFESKKENYSFKWGKDFYNEWKEEWNDKFDDNSNCIEKACFKTNKKFLESIEWYESWNEKFDNNSLIQKNCVKWIKNDSNYFENKWGENFIDKDKIWEMYI